MKKALLLLLCLIIYGRGFAQDDSLPELPGQIAYIGLDFNVYSINTLTHERTTLTDDAGQTPNSIRYYEWPTWSTDGRLAYFQTEIEQGSGRTTRVFISEDAATTGREAFAIDDQAFTYAYWSPQNCTSGTNCRDLAVLMGTMQGFVVEMVRDDDREGSSRTIGTAGNQFYYSWSPDGSRMLWQRDSETLDVYSAAEDRVLDTLTQAPGEFAAPAWSPIDDRWLVGLEGRGGTDLAIVSGGDAQQTETLVSGIEGIVYFSWSPDGNHIAYANREGPLYIIDAISGDLVAQSSTTGVLAFFWSPDSQKIAYITLAAEPGSINAKADLAKPAAQEPPSLAWSVLDIEDETVRRYGAFIPTRDMLYLISFFDQFALSHRLWSPDSRHLVYGEVTADGRPVVSILDTSQELTVPLYIADGMIGVWSFE